MVPTLSYLKMGGLGIRKTVEKIMSANGPAQMLTYSFWGVLMAGMWTGLCGKCYPSELLLLWGFLSASITPITIWCNPVWLRNVLLADVLVSAYIMVIFFLPEPHTMSSIAYYVNTVDGIVAAERNTKHSMSDWFHALSVVWMTLHALYLADLTNRQILEKKRFQK